MKRTSDFRHFSDRARDLIVERGIMHDVILMEELNFTPPSWKVWRSQLIQKFSLMKYNGVTESGKESQYQIKYVKKSKIWHTVFDD